MGQMCIHELLAASCSICNGDDARERARPQPSNKKWAEAIFDLIPVSEDGWISNTDLAERAGLTGAQVASGVAYLRDNHPELPLVSGRQGYCWSLDEAEVNTFRLARVRSANTTVRRLWYGVLKPYLEKKADAAETRLMTKQYERLLEDIEELTA